MMLVALARLLPRQLRMSRLVTPDTLLRGRRRSAVAAYRALLHDDEADIVLTDLLHLHHVRMIGIDVGSERLCLRLTRAAAQNLIARGRSRSSSTCGSGPAPAPTA